MEDGRKPVSNPYVVLREEFDDWAILFDPDTGRGFGLSPTGVYVWKLLDGKHSVSGMFAALCRDVPNVPREAEEHLLTFVEELAQHALAAYKTEQVEEYMGRVLGRPACSGENVSGTMHFAYEQPRLVNLSIGLATGCDCAAGTSNPNTGCSTGACAHDCNSGAGASTGCDPGSGAWSCSPTGSGGYGCYDGSSPGLCNCGTNDTAYGTCSCGNRANSVGGTGCCTGYCV